jgi:hypothetical protein
VARNKSGSLSALKDIQYQHKHKNVRKMTTNTTHTKEQAVSTTMCIPVTPTAMATVTEAWADSPLLIDIYCLVYILQTK